MARQLGILNRVPERVKDILNLFLIEFAICGDNSFLPRACHTRRCDALDDVVDV